MPDAPAVSSASIAARQLVRLGVAEVREVAAPAAPAGIALGAQLRADKRILIALGAAADVDRARELIAGTRAESTEVHHGGGARRMKPSRPESPRPSDTIQDRRPL